MSFSNRSTIKSRTRTICQIQWYTPYIMVHMKTWRAFTIRGKKNNKNVSSWRCTCKIREEENLYCVFVFVNRIRILTARTTINYHKLSDLDVCSCLFLETWNNKNIIILYYIYIFFFSFRWNLIIPHVYIVTTSTYNHI